MFASISMFVRMFFNMMTTTMSAGDHAAKALEHLAITAEETAGAYCDEARSNRAKQLQQLEADLHVATEKTKEAKAAKASLVVPIPTLRSGLVLFFILLLSQ